MPGLLIGMSGCAYLGVPPLSDWPVLTRPPEPTPQANPAVARTMIASAKANRVNLFGEFGISDPGHYYTRAAVSIRQHTFASEGSDQGVDADPHGKRIVFSSTRHNLNPDLYVKSIRGVAVTQLTSDPASDVQPQFSPDVTNVAVASNRGGNWDIWIINVSGGAPVQVTAGPADQISPSWSPQGDRLVYCSRSAIGGQWELWITDATAGAERKFIGYGLFPEWSPVGETIVYQRARARGSRHFSIWTLQMIDGEPRYPTEIASSGSMALIQPTWAADGMHIAYSAVSSFGWADARLDDGEVAADVWIVQADGYGKVCLTNGHSSNFDPTFSPDGRVFFSTRNGPLEHLWSLEPSLSPLPTDAMGIVTRRADVNNRSEQTQAATIIEPSEHRDGD